MKRKIIMSALISIIIVLSMYIGAFAASNLEEVKAYLNHDIKFSLKGEAWQPKDANGKPVYAITYNGSTYLPVRAAGDALGTEIGWDNETKTVTIGLAGQVQSESITLNFPVDKYPETAAHIKTAIAKGESATCTIDREGADENREESLKGIPTKEGYDRDEWPMAMCAEGGAGADIAYVTSSDNRGSGSWVGNQLEDYPNGTRVLFVISGSVEILPSESDDSTTTDTNDEVHYSSCAEVRAAGSAPIRTADPGYSRSLDRDGDGVACE